MEVVYLDTNGWINLHKEYKQGDISDKDIDQLVESDYAFPLSHVTLEELNRLDTEEEREERIEFIYRISQGKGFAPKIFIEDAEIRSALMDYSIEYPEIPSGFLRNIALGEGVPFILAGSNYRLKGAEILPERTRKALEEKVEGEEAFKIYKYDEIAKLAKDTSFLKEYAQRINKGLEKEKEEFSDNDYRYRVKMADFFMAQMRDRVARTCMELGVNFRNIIPDVLEEDEESIEKAFKAFVKDVPSFYTHAQLSTRRDIQANEVDENDMYDVMSLSVAIPYSDIVYTENQWRHRAKNTAGLDEIYDTKITSDWKELKEELGIFN